MASLADTINKNLATPGKRLVRTASGQLVEQATPISQLAGQQGLSAPPTTPGGAAALGASPDSAKMAGTPGQLASAIRQSTDQVNTLQEATADKRYRSDLTAEEQARKDTAAKLQETLGDTRAKAQSLIDAAAAKLTTGPQGYEQWKTDTAAAAATEAATAAEQYAAATEQYNKQVADSQAKQNNVNAILATARATKPDVSKMGPIVSDAALERASAAEQAAWEQATTQLRNLGLTEAEIGTLKQSGAQYTAPTIAAPVAQVVQGTAGQVAAPVVMATPAGLQGYAGKQPEVDSAFSAVLSAGTPEAKSIALANLSALTGKSPDELQNIVSSAAEEQTASAGKAVAGAIGTVSVNDLLGTGEGKLGVDASELAALLGVTPEQVSAMSIDQLDEAVNALGQTTTATQEQATSTLLSSAERGAMREAHKELSTSGAAAIDAQLGALGRELESADQVTFLGKTGSISELLSDDGISTRIEEMLTTGEWEKLPETDPLKQFINKYKEALGAAVGTFESAVAAGSDIAKANEKATTFSGVSLNSNLLKEFVGDVATGGKIDTSKSNVLTWLSTIPEKDAGIVVSTMNSNPTLAKDLNKLTPEQLSELGIAENGPKWQAFQQGQQLRSDWAQVDKSNIDSVLQFLYADAPSGEELNTKLAENARRISAGYPSDPQLTLLDPDRDGVMDTEEKKSLADRIASTLGPSDISEAVQGQKPTFNRDTLAGKLLPLTGAQEHVQKILDTRAVGDALKNHWQWAIDNGKVTVADMEAFINGSGDQSRRNDAAKVLETIRRESNEKLIGNMKASNDRQAEKQLSAALADLRSSGTAGRYDIPALEKLIAKHKSDADAQVSAYLAREKPNTTTAFGIKSAVGRLLMDSGYSMKSRPGPDGAVQFYWSK